MQQRLLQEKVPESNTGVSFTKNLDDLPLELKYLILQFLKEISSLYRAASILSAS
jgi:hypothetical protein